MLLNAVTHAGEEIILKSPADDRDYRHLKLDNNLSVILVSDPVADKSAASMNVAVGSGADPADWSGMAHFLEHMLFLGTEKYPQSGEYQSYIQQHGGTTNAFTAYDQTNYFYDIDPDFLESSLDRFAQFFISPLFSEEFVERERNAVDSEYYARRTDDFRRTWSARKQVFNTKHPITKFSIGNLETLADKPKQKTRDALIEFYQQQYSANIMSLTVIGNEPLDQLEDWVKEKFNSVVDRGLTEFAASEPIYKQDNLPKLLQVQSLKQKYSIYMSFKLPSTKPHYKTKPMHYVSNLLGHEGPGSLLSYLKQQGWAESLSAGLELNNPEGASFAISVKATQRGFEHSQEIIDSAFSYIQILQNQGVKEWLFKEQQQLSQLSFDYLEKSDSSEYAVFLSSALQDYPVVDVITASYLLSHYDESVIQTFVDQLITDNLVVTLVSPEFKSEQVTNYFNTPFSVSSISAAMLEKWNQPVKNDLRFSLPEKNEFIPAQTKLKAVAKTQQHPSMLVNEKGFKFFHQFDDEFAAPRASTYLSIRTPLVGQSAKSVVLMKLFVAMVDERLNEGLYPASIAGLHFDLYSHVRGLSIRITGYDDKQAILLKYILADLFLKLDDESLFNQKYTELIEDYQNQRYDTPYVHLYGQANSLLIKNDWPIELKQRALQSVTFSELKDFQNRFFQNLEVIGLSHGNVTQSDARQLVEIIHNQLTSKTKLSSVPQSQVLKLGMNSRNLSTINMLHEDAAVLLLKQGLGKSIADKASIFMLYQLIEAPFFYQLRTVEQLGYIVNASPYSSLNYPYIAMLIESPSTDVATIIEQIQLFIEQFKISLNAMTADEFELAKNGLITKLEKKDDTLEDRTNRFWTEIDRENYAFDSRAQLLTEIKKLTFEQIKADFDAVFFDPGYGEIAIITPGSLDFDTRHSSLKAYQLIQDEAAFKAQANYF